MHDIRDLYQELIIDHGTHPRNCHALSNANYTAEGFNPLCGDKIILYLLIQDDVVQNVSFQGSGCAISMASASLMTETLKGKTVEEAKAMFHEFQTLLTKEGTPSTNPMWQKLNALSGVRTYPTRVKCATLAWHTLQAAINKKKAVVTTE